MVNGTTYAKKIEVEHKKRKQKYRYRKIYIALLQTIDIESNMTQVSDLDFKPFEHTL